MQKARAQDATTSLRSSLDAVSKLNQALLLTSPHRERPQHVMEKITHATGTRKAEGPGSHSAHLLGFDCLWHFSPNPDFPTVLPNRPWGHLRQGLAFPTSLDCSPSLNPCTAHSWRGLELFTAHIGTTRPHLTLWYQRHPYSLRGIPWDLQR